MDYQLSTLSFLFDSRPVYEAMIYWVYCDYSLLGTYALLRDSKQAVQTGFPNKLCIVSTQNTRDFFLWFVWKHYMQSLFGNSVWTACLESCLEDRPTDRPTNRLLEAPSRSLKKYYFSLQIIG